MQDEQFFSQYQEIVTKNSMNNYSDNFKQFEA